MVADRVVVHTLKWVYPPHRETLATTVARLAGDEHREYMHKRRTHHHLVAVTAAALLVTGAAACGNDDTESSSTEAAAAATTSAAPAATSAAVADAATFCERELDVESAVFAEDPEAIGAAFEALSAASPEAVKGAVDTAIAEAEQFLAADGEPTEAFLTAYDEVVQFVRDNCGFAELDVTAADYNFQGLPAELAAGGVVITFDNQGQEAHELSFMRLNDDVTESLDELLALPEEEAMANFDPSAGGGTFAVPGESSSTVVNLPAGRYVVSCFVPQGMTMEAMAEMETTGSVPEGTPHAMLGMIQELTVA